jgi:uncharacterized membrane protein
LGVGSIFTWWDSIRTSLWFVPVLCVLVAVILSFILPEIDHYVEDREIEIPGIVFRGSSDGARSILSTVAGSLVTIVGVVFSITIVVLQQASTQFTPRVIGNFVRHTGTQLVLGVYLATFLYSVLVLRYVRGEDAQGEEFIPQLSVTFSLLLAAVCLGFLVYFIHHMATSIQASIVIASVHQEFSQDVARLYPEHIGDPAEDDDQPLSRFRAEYLKPPVTVISATDSGYLRSVDPESMVRHACNCSAVTVLPQIGDFITRGMPVVEVSSDEPLTEDACSRIRNGLILGSERSRYQDPLFSIRQLVDITLKALSPSINDPTTANNSISMIGASLAELADRRFPDQIRVIESEDDGSRESVYVWTNRPSYDAYIERGFSEIRRIAISNAAVTMHLVTTLGRLGHAIEGDLRAAAIYQQLREIESALDETEFSTTDEQAIRAAIDEARRRLPAVTGTPM